MTGAFEKVINLLDTTVEPTISTSTAERRNQRQSISVGDEDAAAGQVFGAGVRASRRRAGLSQAELAKRSGMSLRAIRDIEVGKVDRPHPGSVRRLTAVLNEFGPVGFQVSILGRLQLVSALGEVTPTSPALHTLVALFALKANQRLTYHELVDVLWPERPPRSYLNLIHTYVARLRRILEEAKENTQGTPTIERSGRAYVFTASPDCLDTARFAALVAQATSPRATYGTPLGATSGTDATADLLGQALDCWHGPILADAIPELRHHVEAVRLNDFRMRIALQYAEAADAAHDLEPAIGRLRAVLAIEPLNEALTAKLMHALACSGRRAAALDLFDHIRRGLDQQLGVGPGSELQGQHLRLLRRSG